MIYYVDNTIWVNFRMWNLGRKRHTDIFKMHFLINPKPETTIVTGSEKAVIYQQR